MAIHDGLAVTDEQNDLRSTLRDVLTDKLSAASLRAQIGTEDGFDRDLWARLAGHLGLAGLAVAEEYGGLGLDHTAVAIAHQELGRALYPGPHLATSLAATALAMVPDKTIRQRWLPPIAAGECVAACAVAGDPGTSADRVSTVEAARGGGSWRLTGGHEFVLAGHVADVLVVPAATPAGASLFLVERGADGLATAPMRGLDLTRKSATVRLDGTPATLLAREGEAGGILQAVSRALHLATAAEAAGGIDWCLTACTDYAKTREQFGRPIGSFQAVAHTAVDMLAHFEFSRAACRYAAVASAQGDAEAEMATRVAVLRAGEAYRNVAEATIHLFGGTGFTWEHDAHLYYRRAWSNRQLAGGSRVHRASIAALTGL